MAALTAAGFVASTSNAALGIGGGLLVMPLLALWFPPRQVVAYTIPMFFVSSLAIVWRYRHELVREYLYWLIPGALVGVAIGTWLLRSAPSDIVRLAMGGIAVIFVTLEAYRLIRQAPPSPLKRGWSVPFSLAAGLSSAMTNLGGTIISITMLGRGLSPAMFVGTLNTVMLAMSAGKLIGFYSLGIVTPGGLLLALPSVPAVLVGSWLGQRLNQRLHPTVFRWVLVSVIGVSAILLLTGY